MPKQTMSIAASVSARLLKYAQQDEKHFSVAIFEFRHKRLVSRLATSEYRDNLLLNGDVLIQL